MGLLNSEINVFRYNKVFGAKPVSCVFIAIFSLWNLSAFALGMGAAETDSYIGEPLSIHIPIFNVKNPEGLSVILQRIDVSGVALQAVLERHNSQLGVRVTSTGLTSEPYVSFVLEVLDDGDVSSKEFNVLLNLDPRQAAQNAKARQQVYSDQLKPASKSRAVDVVSNDSIMGPYDWAQAGRVPAKFGPVLEGQSLWRVARRINQALGVSVDQMMWSLYESNREQFSNDSITSLRAGAVLRIPSVEQAKALSELESKRRVSQPDLQKKKSIKSPSIIPDIRNATNVDSGSVRELSAVQERRATQPKPSFELTSLDEQTSTGVAIDKSQEIIASLAQAVGSLTQEVIKKDKKISFLEEKIAALEAYAKISASQLPALDQANESQLGVSLLSDANATPSNVLKESLVPSSEVSGSSLSPWHVVMVLSLILLALLILFRGRIVSLYRSLNLFSQSNEIEFDPSVFEQTVSVQIEEHSDLDPDVTIENVKINDGLSQKTILDAIKSAVESDDPLSPQTLIDLDDEFTYTEMLSEASISINESNLTFMERFERAVLQQDYGFARQLLDFARESELDLPLYHYHRLRLYNSMHDEDAFYNYFCEVEEYMHTYSDDLQTKISQLVLLMAQH